MRTAAYRRRGRQVNIDLMNLIESYALRKHSEVSDDLLNKSKSNLVAMLLDLLTAYYNDLNSSTLRETVVVKLAGYLPQLEKLGYNGYRHDAITNQKIFCEVKPKNVRANSPKDKKLNGGGNFTDYTWGKLERHQKENPKMLVAGFVDARLIYIFKFDFNEEEFIARLKEQLTRHFPDGDVTSRWLRSAGFSFRNFKNAKTLKTYCPVPAAELEHLRGRITRPVLKHLSDSSALTELTDFVL